MEGSLGGARIGSEPYMSVCNTHLPKPHIALQRGRRVQATHRGVPQTHTGQEPRTAEEGLGNIASCPARGRDTGVAGLFVLVPRDYQTGKGKRLRGLRQSYARWTVRCLLAISRSCKKQVEGDMWTRIFAVKRASSSDPRKAIGRG